MDLISWLLDGSDPALEFQVRRYLLHEPEAGLSDLRHRIEFSGSGRILLDKRTETGHWGSGIYNPKWTCTHYVLWELVQLEIHPASEPCRQACSLILDFPLGDHGGINYAKTVADSDVCINGMILNFISYFCIIAERRKDLIDYLLANQMSDGGWNCEYLHGARHSSLHTTISVLEGFTRNQASGYPYRCAELAAAGKRGVEFILGHELFKTSTSGEVIREDFFRFCFPVRWKYDILRCLDYLRSAMHPYDPRMEAALSILGTSRDSRGRWRSFRQPGKTYHELESLEDGRKWNTLRALRVLGYFGRI